jgi:integrase
VADGGGLYLLVSPGGSKSWVLRTLVHGKRCDIGLGGLDLVTLAQAREEASKLRRVARTGGDPLVARRQARRDLPTFEEAARRVHESHAAGFRNAKHAKQWLASLGDVFTALGSKRVDTIGSADVLAAVSPFWLTKPETARRVMQRIRVVFQWSKAQGFTTGDNPVEGLTKVLPRHRETRTHHPALPYAAVPAFIEALHESDVIGEVVKLAMEFLVLTASRTSETLNATWDEVDLHAATWTVPASRMKGHVAHVVPLSPRAVAILEQAKALSDGGAFVFPGRRANRPLSTMALLMALRHMGRADVTVHGMRSSFRDWSAEKTNVPRAVCEAALAHANRDRVESAYLRTNLLDLRRDLMTRWSRFVTSKPGDVVAIGA